MIWLLVGAVFFVLEAFAISGVGFLFAACGALTLGGLLAFGVLDPALSFWMQIAWFFGTTSLWALVLWKPIKHWMRGSKHAYSNIIGTRAEVIEEDLEPGVLGKVRWSGTDMQARLVPGAIKEPVRVGAEVWIYETDGTVLLVSELAPPTRPTNLYHPEAHKKLNL